MGTRATTKFYHKDNEGIKHYVGGIYRQYDGYVGGHGTELKDFLKGKKIINGIQEQTLDNAFNGIACMGAAVIAHLKEEIGKIYLACEDNTCFYDYILWNEDENIFIEIHIGDEIFYSGDINDMPDSK
jgi:hypothetical protein